jgi:transcriptional regulator with XRE-family HTH domain
MKRITMEREKRGWSRAELARRTNLHPSQVGQFESGRLVPYPAQLARMAEALGSDADRLMDDVEVTR